VAELTERQKKFVDFYIELGDAAKAAVKAGYSERTARYVGYENLTKPHIRKRIDERLKQLEGERIAGAGEVMKYLSSVMRGETTDEIPLLVGGGEQSLCEQRVTAKDRLRAAELLGKRYGMFSERIQATISAEVESLVPLAELLRCD